MPNELINHDLWWNGPKFLHEIEYEHEDDLFITNEEEKMVVCTTVEHENSILPQASSYGKLRRIMAYVNRFIKKCRGEKASGHLKIHEIQNASLIIERSIQKQYFNEEWQALKHGRNISNSSKIRALCVFMDKSDLIRVGGRLKNSDLLYDMKHQILLPKCEITDLIIQDAHRIGLHSGARLTEAILRKKYWITNSQTCIRKQIKKCVKCARYNPKTQQQLMADLPSVRVNVPDKAFIKSAVDYAGPIRVKASRLRNAKIEKGYII